MKFEVDKVYKSRCGDKWKMVQIFKDEVKDGKVVKPGYMLARFVEVKAKGHEVIMGSVYNFKSDGKYNQGGIHDLVGAAE